ncbi:MAG TPA: bifunctional DNA-formamidopyrimidine glycosylase/DNA-(apurinic or apyrimidinic site) lyase [Roseiflexaceae bacterium]|nr:bifunctional DNA-formamidopyrimidine glycosylase/DNA-(apurinic or apyrimidinic site) lyase [Roseiflexaceae bacterium]
MPELPEVQRAADTLAAQIAGCRIAAVTRLDWPRMVETHAPETFAALLAGRTVCGAARRAKWLLLELDGGWTLALHLRMSGYVAVYGPEAEPDRHTRLALRLADGRQVFFHDARKFGRARLLDAAGVAALDATHGPEPLDEAFTANELARLLRGRRRAIKPLLLDQAVLAGVGNIYADEALWRARIHPLRPADTLGDAEVARLHEAIRAALRDGLERGGSTLRDYRDAYGAAGENQQHFEVYDRAGQPCSRCGTPIVRAVVGQRGTHFCPVCQPCTATAPGAFPAEVTGDRR